MTSSIPFNPATTAATALLQYLDAGTLTTVEMVETHLAQIERFNPRLRALISVREREHVLRVAREIDRERIERLGGGTGPTEKGAGRRSSNGGLCVIVKDVFMTGEEMGMPTTAGAWAFRSAVAKQHAIVIQRLVEKQFIVLGKANMTEWCGLKGSYALNHHGKPGLFPGWSPVGGQTQSPYFEHGLAEGELILGNSSPGGSSSGSAVSVAAGFAPLALGTETAGSVITPANRAGLYAITLTIDRVPMDGIIRLSRSFDRIGAMAKTAADLALLVDALIEEPDESGFRNTDEMDWNRISIGFADPKVWSLPEELCQREADADHQMTREYEKAVKKLDELGAKTVYPVILPLPSVLKFEGQSSFELISHSEFPKLFRDSMNRFKNAPFSKLTELIDFNETHAEHAMPEPYTDQSELKKVLVISTNEPTVQKVKQHMVANAGIDEAMERYGVDIIAAPADSALCSLAAAAGYPIGLVPLGALDSNGRPFGVCLVAKSNQEKALLRFMTAYEQSFPERPIPKLMMTSTTDIGCPKGV